MKTRTELIKFFNHHDRIILYIDYSGNMPDDMIASICEVDDFISQDERGSMLLLENLSDVHFNIQVIERAVQFFEKYKDRLEKVAVFGLDPLKKIAKSDVADSAGVIIKEFEDIELAKDWLVGINQE